jgi:hypothetical protein
MSFGFFIKVRAIYNIEQQKKFDNVIAQVMEMISKAGELPPHDRNRPQPPNGKNKSVPNQN